MRRDQILEIPSDTVLKEKYKSLRNNDGLKSVHDWALPNSAKETDENAVFKRAQKDDDDHFLDVMKKALYKARK